jgi:hypothetical protein
VEEEKAPKKYQKKYEKQLLKVATSSYRELEKK